MKGPEVALRSAKKIQTKMEEASTLFEGKKGARPFKTQIGRILSLADQLVQDISDPKRGFLKPARRKIIRDLDQNLIRLEQMIEEKKETLDSGIQDKLFSEDGILSEIQKALRIHMILSVSRAEVRPPQYVGGRRGQPAKAVRRAEVRQKREERERNLTRGFEGGEPFFKLFEVVFGGNRGKGFKNKGHLGLKLPNVLFELSGILLKSFDRLWQTLQSIQLSFDRFQAFPKRSKLALEVLKDYFPLALAGIFRTFRRLFGHGGKVAESGAFVNSSFDNFFIPDTHYPSTAVTSLVRAEVRSASPEALQERQAPTKPEERSRAEVRPPQYVGGRRGQPAKAVRRAEVRTADLSLVQFLEKSFRHPRSYQRDVSDSLAGSDSLQSNNLGLRKPHRNQPPPRLGKLKPRGLKLVQELRRIVRIPEPSLLFKGSKLGYLGPFGFFHLLSFSSVEAPFSFGHISRRDHAGKASSPVAQDNEEVTSIVRLPVDQIRPSSPFQDRGMVVTGLLHLFRMHPMASRVFDVRFVPLKPGNPPQKVSPSKRILPVYTGDVKPIRRAEVRSASPAEIRGGLRSSEHAATKPWRSWAEVRPPQDVGGRRGQPARAVWRAESASFARSELRRTLASPKPEGRRRAEVRETNGDQVLLGTEDFFGKSRLINHPAKKPAGIFGITDVNGDQTTRAPDRSFPLLVRANLALQDKSVGSENRYEIELAKDEATKPDGWRSAEGRFVLGRSERSFPIGGGTDARLPGDRRGNNPARHEKAQVGGKDLLHFGGPGFRGSFGGILPSSGEPPGSTRPGQPDLIRDTVRYSDFPQVGHNTGELWDKLSASSSTSAPRTVSPVDRAVKAAPRAEVRPPQDVGGLPSADELGGRRKQPARAVWRAEVRSASPRLRRASAPPKPSDEKDKGRRRAEVRGGRKSEDRGEKAGEEVSKLASELLRSEVRRVAENYREKLLPERFRENPGPEVFAEMVRLFLGPEARAELRGVPTTLPLLSQEEIASLGILHSILTHSSETERRIIDDGGSDDPQTLAPWILKSAHNPKLQYLRLVVGAPEKVERFRSKLRHYAQSRYQIPLPNNFQIVGVASPKLLVPTLQKLISGEKTPAGVVSRRRSRLERVGYRGKLLVLRAWGSPRDPAVQIATGLLLDDWLLKENLPLEIRLRIHTGRDLDLHNQWDAFLASLLAAREDFSRAA